jgi:hypothetical protein
VLSATHRPSALPWRERSASEHLFDDMAHFGFYGVWRCNAVVRSAYGVVRQEQRLSGHRSGCGVLVVWWTVSPHYHVEDFSAALHIVHIWTGGTAMGCTRTSVTLSRTALWVLSRTTYFVIRSTFSQLAPHQHRSTPLISEEHDMAHLRRVSWYQFHAACLARAPAVTVWRV